MKSVIDYVWYCVDVNFECLVLLGQSLGGNNVLVVVGYCVGCVNMCYVDQVGICVIIFDLMFLFYFFIVNQMILGSGYLFDDCYSVDCNIVSVSFILVLIFYGMVDYVIFWQDSEKLYVFVWEFK